jgi:dienelactone hydrolase
VILPGSDGRLNEPAAALLASHGYAVLTLAYFGYEGLPEYLIEVPLEYFGKAFDWLKLQPETDEKRLGVIGLSRGGELALLLGATYSDIDVVVAGAPSGIVHTGLSGTRPSKRSAWSLNGTSIPAARVRVSPWHVVLIWVLLVKNLGAFSLRTIFLGTLRAGEEATIKVERIEGPVLLISGEADGLWPATTFAEMVMARLRRHAHPYPDEHLQFKKAGHFVCFPYSLPYLPPMVNPVRQLHFGGSRAANADSAIRSWNRILSFLETSLREEAPGLS